MANIKSGFREGILVLGISLLLAILFNSFSANSISWITEKKVKSEGADNSELGLGENDSTQKDAINMNTDTNANNSSSDSAILGKAIGYSKQDSMNTAQNLANQQAALDSGLAASNKAIKKDSLKKIALLTDSIKKANLRLQLAKKDSLKALQDSNKAAQAKSSKNSGTDGTEANTDCEKIKEITTEQAKALFDKKSGVVFVDARPENQYQEGHIPNAINGYGDQFSSYIPKFLSFPKTTIFVCYCGGGDECHLSHEAAKGLCNIGFKKVFVYKGGTKEWNQNNYPWEK